MAAAAARKLQKDIELALKKVDDGIEEFEGVGDVFCSSAMLVLCVIPVILVVAQLEHHSRYGRRRMTRRR